jgi:DNA-binding FadR family transcriptional regulator
MSSVKFEPLKMRRLSEVIENSIKDLIVSGQLKVGSRLPTEPEIASQFGVSLVTVREALRGLETFGIIRKKRGKDGGIFVSEIQSNVVKSAVHNFLISRNFSAADLGEMRDIVEPATIAIAAQNITPEEIEAVENNVKYCEERIEKRKNSFSSKVFFDVEERNVEFHRCWPGHAQSGDHFDCRLPHGFRDQL